MVFLLLTIGCLSSVSADSTFYGGHTHRIDWTPTMGDTIRVVPFTGLHTKIPTSRSATFNPAPPKPDLTTHYICRIDTTWHPVFDTIWQPLITVKLTPEQVEKLMKILNRPWVDFFVIDTLTTTNPKDTAWDRLDRVDAILADTASCDTIWPHYNH